MKLLLVLLLVFTLGLRVAHGQVSPVAGIQVDQKLGDTLPLETVFRDETGQPLALGDCFHGHPVVLALVYYRCPQLCVMTLGQLTRSVTILEETAGKDFDIVIVSINPAETPAIAMEQKSVALRAYRRPAAGAGWHFLTGDIHAIQRLTSAVGFDYRYDDATQQYIHPTALVALTPRGRISRYFLGVEYPPNDLRTALHDAAQERISPPAEAVYFYCLRYDPVTGQYGLIIGRALRALAAVTLAGIALLIFCLHRADPHRNIPKEGAAT